MQPPHDIHAEQAVLATLILDLRLADVVRARLPEITCFADARHAAVYEALLSMADAGEAHNSADAVTVTVEMARLGGIRRFKSQEEAYGLIESIVKRVPGVRNYDAYANLVRTSWIRRRITAQHQKIAALAGLPDQAVMDVLDRAQRETIELTSLADWRSTVPFKDAADEVLYRAVDRFERARGMDDGQVLGLPCGLPALTSALGGFEGGSLVLVAADPGKGKSTMMMQMAGDIAAGAKERLRTPDAGGAYIASLEMPPHQLAEKVLFADADVDGRSIRRGTGSEEDLERLEQSVSKLRGLPIYIDDLPSATWPQIRSRIVMARNNWGIEVAFIDYIQKISRPAPKNRFERLDMKDHVQSLAADCKTLAKQLDIPIIAMAQFRRRPTRKDGGTARPHKSDLGESSYLEKDADQILLLWPRGAPLSDPPVTDDDFENYTAIIDKARLDRTADVPLIFNMSRQRFEAPPKPTQQSFVSAAGPRSDWTEKEPTTVFDVPGGIK